MTRASVQSHAHGGGLEALCVIDAVGLHGLVGDAVCHIAARRGAGVAEICELGFPVPALFVQQSAEPQQGFVVRALVEPRGYEGFVLPAIASPGCERSRRHRPQLVVEVARECERDARIAGGFKPLHQDLAHDHARPPVIVGERPDHAAGLLVLQRPVDETFGLRLESRVVQQNGQGNQPVEEVWTAFPALALASEPAAVEAYVGPELVQMPAHTVGLDAQLTLQPPGGVNFAERKRMHRGGGEFTRFLSLNRKRSSRDTHGRGLQQRAS